MYFNLRGSRIRRSCLFPRLMIIIKIIIMISEIIIIIIIVMC